MAFVPQIGDNLGVLLNSLGLDHKRISPWLSNTEGGEPWGSKAEFLNLSTTVIWPHNSLWKGAAL